MVRAMFNGTVVAESEEYEVVEGNVYFPPGSLKQEYFSESELQTRCGWKGQASYYTVSVDGVEARDVAWYYPSPSNAAQNIKDHVAFYPEVSIEG
jgi:uncharacterized protein (DUF427 family)